MIPSYILTPGVDQKEESLRRKVAYALMAQGSSGEPIQHWAQGLARMAQGALGGYEIYQDKEERNAREAKIAAALSGLPGLGAEGGAQPAAPVAQQEELPPPPPRRAVAALAAPPGQPPVAMPPPAAPVTTGRAPVMPSAKVWGDREAQDAGLYPPDPTAPPKPLSFNDRYAALPQSPMGDTMQPRPVPTERITQALQPAPAPAPPKAAPQRAVPTIPPAEANAIRELMRDPSTRAIGMQRYQELMKPKDQQRPLTDPAERARYGIGPEDKTPYQVGSDNKVSPINPQPFQVNVNQQKESAYDVANAKSFAELNHAIPKAATSARGKITTITRLGQLLSDPAIFTGAGAGMVLDAKRLAKSAGIDVGDLGGAEAVRSIQNQFALELRNPSGGAGMPGAMSDQDRAFLQSMPPGLERTKEGSALIGDYMKRVAQRDLEIERLRQKYVKEHKRLDDGFYQTVADFADANPIFTEKDSWGAAPAGAGSGPNIDDLVKKYAK